MMVEKMVPLCTAAQTSLTQEMCLKLNTLGLEWKDVKLGSQPSPLLWDAPTPVLGSVLMGAQLS